MKNSTVGKYIVRFCITIIIVIMACFISLAATGNETVYVTNTGECYHSSGCGYLRKSCIPISLEDAVSEGYRRCSRCHPPTYTAEDDYETEKVEIRQPIERKEPEEIDSIVQPETEKETHVEKKNTFPWWIIFIAVPCGLIGINICSNLIDKKKEEKKKALEEQRLKEEKAAFIKMLDGRPLREVANVPPNIRFVDGMPADNNDQLYGTFTVYISKNGKRYHEKIGCSSAHSPKHRFNAIKYYSPCYKCCKDMSKDIPQWYKDYESLEKECKKYGIDIHINEKLFPKIEGTRTYYCKNGESVTIKDHPEDDEMMIVDYKGKEYIRSKTRIGVDFFEKAPIVGT